MDMYSALFAKAISKGGGGSQVIYVGFDWNAKKLEDGYDFSTLFSLLEQGNDIRLKRSEVEGTIYSLQYFSSAQIIYAQYGYSQNISKMLFSFVILNSSGTIETMQVQR